jgi:hypothetical protein
MSGSEDLLLAIDSGNKSVSVTAQRSVQLVKTQSIAVRTNATDLLWPQHPRMRTYDKLALGRSPSNS